jgi:uncharacterized protein (DUF58 family)
MAATSSPAFAAAKLIDPQALMMIRSLELRARAVVEGFWSGMHRSPYHGFSVEFTEYRQYTTGDDPRYLDWRVFARSDRYYIKKYEDETNLRVHVIADQSRSMDYGSRGFTKATYASTLAATLAYFLHGQGDAVGLLTFDEKVREYLPARHRLSHLRQLMLALEKPTSGKATDLVAPIERMTTLIRKRGLVTLLSDFLAPIDRLERSLVALTAMGQEVTIFHIVDPAETTLAIEGASLFEDVESAGTLYIDPAAARESYMKKFAAHTEALRAICRKLGVNYHHLSTEQPLEIALFEFLQERMRKGRQFRRAAGNGGGS